MDSWAENDKSEGEAERVARLIDELDEQRRLIRERDPTEEGVRRYLELGHERDDLIARLFALSKEPE